MRVSKDAEERKTEILDAADALFTEKGYDATTISDIIEKVGVARGTVYYHFKSKEDVLDALVNRTGEKYFTAARRIASDRSIPILDRLLQALLSLHMEDDAMILQQIHKPQNALMHMKTHQMMLENIPEIIADVIEDGIRQGIFDTPYPLEAMEMVITYVNTAFDGSSDNLPEEQMIRRLKAFIFNLERLFGARPGSLEPIMKMFQRES